MSHQYSFVECDSYKGDAALGSAVEDGVGWNQEEEEQEQVEVTFNYAIDSNATLNDNNNESYLTADDTSNETQFFSVLETTPETLLNNFGDISVDCNETVTGNVEESAFKGNVCTIGGQPDIYRIEGSDDLYAFEYACDEEGNIQRFRYKLRANENGEYETIPDSIELLQLEDDSENLNCTKTVEEEKEIKPPLESVTFFVKEEAVEAEQSSEDDSNDGLHVIEDETPSLSFEEEIKPVALTADSKAGIIQQNILEHNTLDTEKTPYGELIFDHTNESIGDTQNNSSAHFNSTISLANFKNIVSEEDPNYQEITKSVSQESSTNEKVQRDPLNENTVEEVFIPDPLDENSQNSFESHISGNNQESGNNIEYLPRLNENEIDDTDEYEIVDGIHITADTESQEVNTNIIETFIQREVPLQNQILKIQQQLPILQNVNDLKENKLGKNVKLNKGITYYVVKHPEKENVATIAQHTIPNKVLKTNPRSILKSSYPHLQQNKEKEKDVSLPVSKMERRFPRSKEAIQARVLQNFIAKTTILHAPVRQQRLPRKQTIKPVVRADEEIVVQEMVVSSNGFVEATEDDVVKSKVPPKSTEIVHVSDSDDDYDPKKEQKRKKRYKKRKSKAFEIVISDSDDETSNNDNLVHIDLSAESDENDDESNESKQSKVDTMQNLNNEPSSASESKVTENEENENDGNTKNFNGIKKRRGRPPKRTNVVSNDGSSTTDGSSSSKKQRRNTKDSFESSESAENKSEEKLPINDSEVQNIKTKWKCMQCPKTFPSQGSLKSHMQYHNFHEPTTVSTRQSSNKQETVALKKSNIVKDKYKCEKCGEFFKNNILLSRHVNEHNTGSKRFECSICKKLFSDRAQLINHKRTHIKEQMFRTTTLPKHSPKSTNTLKTKPSKDDQLKCNYCTKVFSSLILLNAHVRTHKRFTCSNCKATFLSKLALEDHVRQNCVKQSKSPKRLAYKTRKSLVAQPKRASKRLSLRNTSSTNESSSNEKKHQTNVISGRIQCDSCKMSFMTHAALYKHKVITHGFNTPDKKIIIAHASCTKSVHKETGNHSSVPAARRLRTAFDNLKVKLEK